MPFPASVNNLTATHSSNQSITSVDINAQASDINALTIRVGPGVASGFQRTHLAPIGLVGQGDINETLDTVLLASQYTAGVRMRLLEPKWGIAQTSALATLDATTMTAYQARIDAFIATGPDTVICLDLGMQYCGTWVENQDPILDQYNVQWKTIRSSNSPVANVFWSPTVRTWATDYVQKLFAGLNFHGRLWGVRTGPNGGEWALPGHANGANPSSFWAYDGTAQTQAAAAIIGGNLSGLAPPRSTKSGLSTFSNGTQAINFYGWYVDSITEAANWLHDIIRLYTTAWICPLTPGGGMWQALVTTLSTGLLDDIGQSPAGSGNWWERMYGSISPLPASGGQWVPQFRSRIQGCMNWNSGLGDVSGNGSYTGFGGFEFSRNPWDWSSAHAHGYLANQNGRLIYSENPGAMADSSAAGMIADFNLLRAWGYSGTMWVRQSQMTTGGFATLANLATQIATDQGLP